MLMWSGTGLDGWDSMRVWSVTRMFGGESMLGRSGREGWIRKHWDRIGWMRKHWDRIGWMKKHWDRIGGMDEKALGQDWMDDKA
jgi:hypothetical protein